MIVLVIDACSNEFVDFVAAKEGNFRVAFWLMNLLGLDWLVYEG